MRIAILDDWERAALASADWSELRRDCQIVVFNEPIADRAELIRKLADCQAVCLMRERTQFPAAVIEALPQLRLIVTTGMRNGAIDLAAATRRGIVVSGTRGSSGSTCELTWGLILAAARHIPAADARLRQGRWTVPMGMGLEGRTLGVVGLGRIGAQVAKVGAAFGMKVMAWSRSLTHDKAAAVGVQRAELDTLLSSADVVSIHLVLAAETRGLIGRTRLETMKPGSILVNTARAAIVDEAALVDALNQGQIAAAGLDVFWVEPLPEGHALKSLDNVVLTPHLGYVTTETWRQFFADVVEDIRAFRAGNPVRLVG